MPWKHFLRWQSNSWHFASLAEVFKASDYKIFNATPYPPGILVKRNDDSGQGWGGFCFTKSVHIHTNTHTNAHLSSFIFFCENSLVSLRLQKTWVIFAQFAALEPQYLRWGKRKASFLFFFKICKRFPSIPGHQHSVFKLGRSGKKFIKDQNCSK